MTNHSTCSKPAATIDGLLRQLQERRLSRRGFVRSAVLLGLSAGAAELLSACAVDQTAPGIPTPTYAAPSARATTVVEHIDLEKQSSIGVPNPKELPTYVPPPAPTPVPGRSTARTSPPSGCPSTWARPSGCTA